LEVEETDRPEQLVPIRLDFDVEHHKMKDTFVWNLNGEWLKRMRRCNNLLFGPTTRFFGCVRARNLFFFIVIVTIIIDIDQILSSLLKHLHNL